MPKLNTDQLTQRFEQVIQEHLAAIESAAAEAIARAFTTRRAGTRRSSSPAPGSASTSGRRSASEMAALCERLYQAVSARPGETMTTLAQELSQPPRTLSRPMDHLRQQGRVRSAGQRHLTRYYPLSPKG